MSFESPEGTTFLHTPSNSETNEEEINNFNKSKQPELIFEQSTSSDGIITTKRTRMIIFNRSDRLSLAYKVQSNAQQKYAVTPRSGIVPPGSNRELFVAIKDTTNQIPSNGDKMLIRCVGIQPPSDKEQHIKYSSSIWNEAPKKAMLKLFVPCLLKPFERAPLPPPASHSKGLSTKTVHEEEKDKTTKQKGTDPAKTDSPYGLPPPPPPKTLPPHPSSLPDGDETWQVGKETSNSSGSTGSSTGSSTESRRVSSNTKWLENEASSTTKSKLSTFDVGRKEARPIFPAWNGLPAGIRTSNTANAPSTTGNNSEEEYYPELLPHLVDAGKQLSQPIILLIKDGSRAPGDKLTKEEVTYLTKLHNETSNTEWNKMRNKAKRIRKSLIEFLINKKNNDEEKKIKQQQTRNPVNNPVDVILKGIADQQNLRSFSSLLPAETNSSRLRKMSSREVVKVYRPEQDEKQEEDDDNNNNNHGEKLWHSATYKLSPNHSSSSSSSSSPQTMKWSLHIDPKSKQVSMLPTTDNTKGNKGRRLEESDNPKDREKKWNSFHHIKRTSVSLTPRSGSTDDDDIGYSSFLSTSTTSKYTAQKSKVERLSKTTNDKRKKKNNKKERPNSAMKISSRSRMNQPVSTNSSALRRRLSHVKPMSASDLMSRKQNDRNVAVPWISATRRNTFVGTHGSGISTNQGSSMVHTKSKKWGGKYTRELSPERNHTKVHPPGTMRPPWLGPAGSDDENDTELYNSMYHDADERNDSKRGLQKNVFIHPGQTNSSILRRRVSHHETDTHTSSWVPASKRGQHIIRDEAGLFSRLKTREDSSSMSSSSRSSRNNRSSRSSSGSGSGSGSDSGSGSSSKNSSSSSSSKRKENVSKNINKPSSSTSWPVGNSDSSENATTTTTYDNDNSLLLSKLVEYENQLNAMNDERNNLLNYISTLKNGERKLINNRSQIEKTIMFDGPLGIVIGYGSIVGVVDRGSAADIGHVHVGDTITAVGRRRGGDNEEEEQDQKEIDTNAPPLTNYKEDMKCVDIDHLTPHELSECMSNIRKEDGIVYVTFLSISNKVQYTLIPTEGQLHVLPTLNDIELNTTAASNNNNNNSNSNNSGASSSPSLGTLSVHSIKEMMVYTLQKSYGWMVNIDDLIISSKFLSFP
jgi:hypothetical protein